MTQRALRFAARTDVGKKRDHNEDNFLVDKKLGLFVVCDGMGGHAAGEVASAIAVRTVHDELRREAELLSDYAAGKAGIDRVSKRDVLNMLEFCVNRASNQVHGEALKDPDKRGMGTTLVGLLVVGSQAFIVHVGDSRLYLLRDGLLEQVTEDHNVHNELIRRKKMTRDEVVRLAPKNAITRAVGVYEHCEPDTLVLDLVAGDRFLLCSDGLSQYYEDNLAELALALASTDEQAVAVELIDTANARGGSDNITAIVVTVGDVGERDEGRARQLQLKREVLAAMPLFRHLNDLEILRVLQVTEALAYTDGETVFTEGEQGDALFIVLDGQVDVLRGDAKLTTLSRGEHFGEMALIREQPRSASVRSSGQSELIALRRTDFFEILRTEHQLAVKLLWQFLGVLADRLASTSRELGVARSELAAEDISMEIFAEEDEDRRTAQLPPPPAEPGSGEDS